ncbi:MAG: exodeoxyribonuclease III [Bellilinea sp.]
MTSLKITTWNVNGYRAVLKKGFDSWIRQDQSDVICLQEVKTRPDQVDEVFRSWDGYDAYWNPAERPGYSGVAVFTRTHPLEIGYGLDDARFDSEGRVIWLRFSDFTLYNIYFPNGQRGMDRVAYKLDFYSRLLEICSERHSRGERVILTGDFNTAHQEIDLANPKQNSHISGFLPEERAWVTRYLENGFIDAFRHLYPDKVQYTWWTYITNARARNVGWRLDYYLVSSAMMSGIKDVEIQDQVMGSDHCPVSIFLK